MQSQTIPEPEYIDVDGVSIRIARGGAKDELPILLTSPWPQSIYAFRLIWSKLAALGPLIAVDLPAFGRSEISEAALSPTGMGKFYIRLLETLDIDRCHVIAPDVGTAASLFAAFEAPDLFATVTVGSGGTDMDLVGERLRAIIKAPLNEIDPGDDAAGVVTMIETLSANPPPADVMEDYRLSCANGRYLEAAKYVRAYPADLPVLQDVAKTIRTPVLVISGRTDPLVPPANGELLQRLLPHCRHEILQSGHFVWEDAADECARLVTDWIRTNGGPT